MDSKTEKPLKIAEKHQRSLLILMYKVTVFVTPASFGAGAGEKGYLLDPKLQKFDKGEEAIINEIISGLLKVDFSKKRGVSYIRFRNKLISIIQGGVTNHEKQISWEECDSFVNKIEQQDLMCRVTEIITLFEAYGISDCIASMLGYFATKNDVPRKQIICTPHTLIKGGLGLAVSGAIAYAVVADSKNNFSFLLAKTPGLGNMPNIATILISVVGTIALMVASVKVAAKSVAPQNSNVLTAS